jgi:uncharacterized membrane protein (DUF4010 family)
MTAFLPAMLVGFLETLALAVIVGLELHAYRRRDHPKTAQADLGFGTTRTIALIAAFGFVLWSAAPVMPFCTGLLVLGALLVAEFLTRLRAGDPSLLPSVIALLAYALGPFVLTAPLAVVAALVVAMLLALGEQAGIRKISDAFPAEEGVTLAKFVILAGLIFPLLPDTAVFGLAGITYPKIWTAVLVISGISYLGYLAHRYLFPRAGTLLTGVLGGLYSSTAATVVLARAARAAPDQAGLAPAAVIIATAMMYARLLVVILLLGHAGAAASLALPFGFFFAVSLGLSGLLAWRAQPENTAAGHPPVSQNPLDLPIAFLFAALFVAFAAITDFVTAHYGANGLHLLSFVVGFSDIDPFIFSLLDGKFAVGEPAIVSAVLIASGSNNLLKAGYALALSRSRAMLPAAAWLAATLALSVAYATLA